MLCALFAPAEKRGTYGALICGADVPDRDIRERLEAQGFTGIVSESGQWVLVDGFGDIERIALDEYPARILPFDPRNDGYAEKLHSLFVRDDRRFLYIPLSSPPGGPAGIEQKLAAALDGIPFTFYTTANRPRGLFLALFCLTASAFFFIRPLRLMLRPHAACLLPLLPALAPLAWGGAAGFALASLLAGCAVLLAGPYLNWRLSLPSSHPAQAKQAPALCRVLPPMFLIFYGVIAFFSGLHPLVILPVTVFFCGILILQLRDAYQDAANGDENGVWGFFKRRDTDRRRFSPVSIFSRRSYTFTFAFSWAMLPFAAVALVLAGAGLVISTAKPVVVPTLPTAGSVTEADYLSHYRFQSTFSIHSLHEPEQDMGIYELAPDGLLGKTDNSVPEFINADVPPFPLDDLVQYLNNPGRAGRGATHTLLAALLPLLFVFPILFRRIDLLPNQPYWSTLLKRLA